MEPIAEDSENRGVGFMSATSSTLLEGLKDRDGDAWERLVRLYGPLVYYWCRKRGVQPHVAVDLMKEVFQAVDRKIDDFHHSRPGNSFREWLYTITQHKIIDFERSRAKHREAEGGTAALEQQKEISDLPSGDIETGDFDERRSVVYGAMRLVREQFPEHYWLAFWRRTVDEQPAGDVADELGISTDLVHQANSRVRKALRELLSDFREQTFDESGDQLVRLIRAGEPKNPFIASMDPKNRTRE
jgi:RNA polymerase sigma-70 factor (ECF subfamily)